MSNPYRVYYDNYMNTNAATEVTGLICSGAYSHEEWDAYREIFNFEPIPHRESLEFSPGGTELTWSDTEMESAAPYKAD